MTGSLSGEILPAALPSAPHRPAAAAGVLEQLLREWLIGYGSANTRTAYDGDLTNWLAFLDRFGVDPLTAAWSRSSGHARAAEQRSSKMPPRADP